MKNLQNLFDAYLQTQPSSEKIKSATSMMIHVGKALNVPTQEEITAEYYSEIVAALDDYFFKSPHKARLDKAILAEMIGRVGPENDLKKILEKLLIDEDEEVRQFALQSLEFYGSKYPHVLLPYVERYREAVETNLGTTAAHLISKLLCSYHHEILLERMAQWCKSGCESFVVEILKRLVYLYKHGGCENSDLDLNKIIKWGETNCGNHIRNELEAVLK